MEESKVEQVSNSALQKLVRDFARLKDYLGEEVSRLWSDAEDFLREAIADGPGATPARTQRVARAAVLTAAAAFEAVTNYLSEQVVQAGEVLGKELRESEIDCLREKRKVLENGKIMERKQTHSSKDRFLLLYSLLSKGRDLRDSTRARLNSSFRVRDGLVHPKPGASIDLLRDDAAEKAVMGFLIADLLLAAVWANAGGHRARPTVGLAALLRPGAKTDNGEAHHGQGKI